MITLDEILYVFWGWIAGGTQWVLAHFPISLFVLGFLYYFISYLLGLVRLYLTALVPFWGTFTQVVRCADGDTLVVGNPRRKSRRYKVRLIGIDTPESLRSLYQDVMPFGAEASAYTKRRLKPGRRIILIYDADRRDQFGRLLAYVYLPNGEFFNATLVRKGYAFAITYPPNVRHAPFFKKLENKPVAAAAASGLSMNRRMSYGNGTKARVITGGLDKCTDDFCG